MIASPTLFDVGGMAWVPLASTASSMAWYTNRCPPALRDTDVLSQLPFDRWPTSSALQYAAVGQIARALRERSQPQMSAPEGSPSAPHDASSLPSNPVRGSPAVASSTRKVWSAEEAAARADALAEQERVARKAAVKAEAQARRAAEEAAIREKEEAEEVERSRAVEAAARQDAMNAAAAAAAIKAAEDARVRAVRAAEDARIRKLESEAEAVRLAEEAEKAAIRAKEAARIDALAEQFYMGSPDPKNVPALTVSQTRNGVGDARKELELLWAAEEQKKRMWAEIGVDHPDIALVMPPHEHHDFSAAPVPRAETSAAPSETALPPAQTPPPQAGKSSKRSMSIFRARSPSQSSPTRAPPTISSRLSAVWSKDGKANAPLGRIVV